MAHTLPPSVCSSNIPTWTDPTLTASLTKVRKVHMDELRTKLNAEFTRRLTSTASFTDPTLTVSATQVRKVHIDELRTQLEQCKSVRGQGCPNDNSGCMDFNDPVITASVTKIRRAHIIDMRDKIHSLMTSCICEVEQCQYCSDCGYYYTTCSHASVACDDHKYSECSYTIVPHRVCGSYNLSAGAAHPWKSWSTGGSGVAWDGTVPWNICNYTPPGKNWTGPKASWSCKCNPFTY